MTEQERFDRIREHVRGILELVGENPDREGLQDTPERVAKMYTRELLSGYNRRVEEIVNGAVFNSEYSEMIVVKDIDFYSLCEHHMVPFFGVAHVAYIPKGKIIGLSKIPRIVDMFARRLQIQEQMTVEIAQTISDLLNPLGVAVVIEGMHLCSVMRGVEKPRNKMVTSELIGAFQTNHKTREEFLMHISRSFSLNK